MNDVEREFHETWLGMVQPIEGLVVSVPVLTDAQCFERQPPERQRQLLALCQPRTDAHAQGADEQVTLADLPAFLAEWLELTPDLWDAAPGYREDTPWAGRLAEDLSVYAPEGPQTVAPTLGLRKLDPVASPPSTTNATHDTPASRAGAGYELLLWQLPEGLDLDQAETTTGEWSYPPQAKFDRLLRACRVPIGLLVNGHELRLCYAPPGEASGHLTFRLADMATVGGRPILDACGMLLHARRFFSVAEDRALPALLAESRKRQADVTDALGKQVLEALTLLLRGFEAAADRDGRALLDAALARENDHLYQGLLTVLLRMVFVLYAEDRGLLPVDQPLYAQHLSLVGLFDELTDDHGMHPDTMSRRHGAWGRLVALFRALYVGVTAGELHMPERRGTLFSPHLFAFLEGWTGPSAPLDDLQLQAGVAVPSLDDGTIHQVLRKLIVLDGQRLSYRTLDVEQIGSLYEGLLGYHVVRMPEAAVCMRPDGVWLSLAEVRAVPTSRRAAFLKEQVNLTTAQAKKLAAAVTKAGSDDSAALEELQAYAVGRTKEARAQQVAHAGQLVLQPGEERRRTSSHYTPKSLTSQVVSRTLQPLLACMTPEGAEGPSSERILALRVCDPAMGSGAFLVEACRYLGSALEAAWAREGLTQKHRDPELAARRRVAQCCLYGVDKNPAAVELGKLSLWLVTLSKHRPFTFLDSNLRAGDSLVGLSLEQLCAFHWAPQPGENMNLAERSIHKVLEEAVGSRDKLRELALLENGLNPNPREKELLHRDAEDALVRLKLVGDVCLGAFFGASRDRDREQERLRRRDLVVAWLDEDDPEREAALREPLLQMQRELRETQRPFHWLLEFPDVMWDAREDPLEGGARNGAAQMDALVGNPPFMGKNGISGQGGENYLDWLQTLHPGAHGNADLSAHFFRRAARLLGRHGTAGLIATNTIAQGDTRATGLQALLNDGWTIYGAITNLPWPGAAGVTVSIVHLGRGAPMTFASLQCEGLRCDIINSQLAPRPERDDPNKLAANVGCAYQGSIVLGMGFMLTPEERDALLAKNPRNAECIFPYLGGQEVNTSPTQNFDRYVISFGDRTLEDAEAWPDLLAIVREKVKPERDKNKREVRRKYWWRFGETTPALYKALAPLSRCLVTARVTKHLCISFQPTDRILNEKLYVFPLDHHAAFAVLQSRIHEPWVRLHSSTLKTDLNYSASDCFDTFPFPAPDPRTPHAALEQAGQALYETRAAYMVETDQGLTKTYNALKNPDCHDAQVLELRSLHEAMDAAVLEAYGWGDLQVPPFCPLTQDDEAALASFQSTVTDRLFVLNAARAEAETLQGLGSTKRAGKQAAKASKPRAKRAAPKPVSDKQTKLPETISSGPPANDNRSATAAPPVARRASGPKSVRPGPSAAASRTASKTSRGKGRH